MTGKVGQDASYIYTYNLQNRLATATITRMEGTQLVDITSAYVYNQSGIRVLANTSTKIDGGTADVKTTVYLTDPANFTGYAQVVEEKVNGTLTKSYTLGDDVLSQSNSLQPTAFLMYDGHGSTRLLTSASSAVSARFDYDAYGKNLFSANVTSPSATDVLYSGEQFDPNLQMQYLRARYYDQNSGRFNRLDDYMGNNQDPQSLHKYAYCHGDAVNGIDPTGRMSLVEVTATLAITTIVFQMITAALVGNRVGENNAIPDGFIISAGVSATGFGAVGNITPALLIDFRTLDVYLMLNLEFGINAISSYESERYANIAPTPIISFSFAYMNSPQDFNGHGFNGSFPKVLGSYPFFPYPSTLTNRVNHMMNQFAKYSNVGGSKYSLMSSYIFGWSPSNAAYAGMSRRSNSFTWTWSWTFGPWRILKTKPLLKQLAVQLREGKDVMSNWDTYVESIRNTVDEEMDGCGQRMISHGVEL